MISVSSKAVDGTPSPPITGGASEFSVAVFARTTFAVWPTIELLELWPELRDCIWRLGGGVWMSFTIRTSWTLRLM
jgi:hypothetical protein